MARLGSVTRVERRMKAFLLRVERRENLIVLSSGPSTNRQSDFDSEKPKEANDVSRNAERWVSLCIGG